MKLFDQNTWQEVGHTLRSNRKRTVTTAFGIFWGIFILVILLSTGTGIRNAVERELRGVTTNMAFVSTSLTARAYKGFQRGRYWYIPLSDMERIKKLSPDIEYVVPMSMMNQYSDTGNGVFYGDKKMEASVVGVTGDYSHIMHYNIHSGRFLSDMDDRTSRPVCVVGTKIANSLLGGAQEALGKVLRINEHYYTVVGVVSDIAQKVSIGARASESVFLPYSIVDAFAKYPGRVYGFFVSVRPEATVAPVLELIKKDLYRRNDIHPQDEEALFLFDTSGIFQFFTMLLLSINILIWIVGTGTLISGIVGVSNIMLVTVRERTREIGVRRAIGGRPVDIVMQVLLESLSITVLAGLLGIVCGTGIMSLVNAATAGASASEGIFLYNPFFSFSEALATFGVIITGGLLGGCLPAFRAVRIKAIDAIREE